MVGLNLNFQMRKEEREGKVMRGRKGGKGGRGERRERIERE